MTCSQGQSFRAALARIEELRNYDRLAPEYRRELEELLVHYAGSIVQLEKLAQEMRSAQLSGIQGDMFLAIRKYDKFMNGGKDE